MANNLYKEYGGSIANNGVSQILQQVREMQKTFKGDPKQMVEQLLRSGQMTQQQFNELAAAANQILPMLK